MITNTRYLEKCCQYFQKIENYAEAVKSPLKYDLHHRREIYENKSRKQLIAENLYYGRPPEELIFLEHGEHIRLHNANLSEETRKRMSDAQKGRLVSEDTRKKLSDAKKGENNPRYWKGKHLSQDTRQKISENNSRYWKGKLGPNRGKRWHLENGRRIYTD